MTFDLIDQGSLKYGPYVKLGLPPIFVWPTKWRMVFMFLNGWKKYKWWINVSWHVRVTVSIKFCWNTNTLTLFSLFCGCFCTTVAEWSCDRDHVAHRVCLALYKKHLLTSVLDHFFVDSTCFILCIFDENALKILVYNSAFILFWNNSIFCSVLMDTNRLNDIIYSFNFKC